MKREAKDLASIESRLAKLLCYGTWLASVLVGIGLVLSLVSDRVSGSGAGELPGASTVGLSSLAAWAVRIITLGIACFILLPVSRVIVMLALFVRQKDYRFVLIAALVLLIILAGFLLGMQRARPQIAPNRPAAAAFMVSQDPGRGPM